MKRILRHIVYSGIDSDTTTNHRDEIRLINSIALHSTLFTVVSAILGIYLLPEHASFIAAVALAETTAKICVILLHQVKRYLVAKLLFSYITLIVFLFIVAYFGIRTNFHFLILTTFFMLTIIFRNSGREDMAISAVYLLVGVGVTAILYALNDPVMVLNSDEIDVARFIAYVMNVSLILMVTVVFIQSSRHRRLASQENIKELSGVANILHTISDNMNDGIFKSDPDAGFEFCNESFARIFGYGSSEELLKHPPVDLYPTENERTELIDDVKAAGTITNRLVRYRRKNGNLFWGRLSCQYIEEEGTSFIVGTVTDVTEQQEAEIMLRESEDQLREAQRIARIGDWQLFNATRILRWSEECIRIHGYHSLQSDYDFREWLDRLEDMDEERIEMLMAKAMMSKENVEFNSWYTTPDGERKYLVYITRYRRSDKVKGGIWYGTVQDYTDQHLAEQRILETKQFYESWIDRLPIETVMFDENYRYLYISESAIRDKALREWLIGKRNEDYAEYRQIKDREFIRQRDEMVRQVFESGEPARWEEAMVRPDGTTSHHMRYLFRMEIIDRGKTKSVVVGYSFDINEIKSAQIDLMEANDELRALNAELDRFVYSISHDLRAPVASLLALVRLTKEAASEEELNEMLSMQSESLHRMEQYIFDVIDYSRNKRLNVEQKPIDLEQLVQNCISDLSHHVHGLKPKFVFDLRLASIATDELRLKIIVNNLISNAIKYYDPEKEEHLIHISSYEEDGCAVLKISDNGVGIASEHMPKIWDMFFRGTSESAGSGLGLYILKESVQTIGGKVEVESNMGEGSTFIVRFPLDGVAVNSDHLLADSSQ